MTIEELNRAIKACALPPLLFFCGEEEYLAENRIAAVRKKLIPPDLTGFNFVKFSGKTAADDIIAAAEVVPQGCDKRVVLAVDSGIFDNLNSAEFKKIKAYAADLPEYVCLIFWERGFEAKKMRSLKFIDDIGGVVSFELQPVNKLEIWVEKMLAKAQKTIPARELSYFVRTSGSSMRKLETECGKLIRYMGDSRHKVTRSDIDAVVDKSAEVQIYDIFSRSILEGHAGRAKEQLRALRLKNVSPVFVIGVILDQVYELLLCKLLSGDGLTAREMLEYYDRRPPLFAVNKAIENSKRFSEERLNKMVDSGLKYSMDIKTGRISGWDAAELYVSELICRK